MDALRWFVNNLRPITDEQGTPHHLRVHLGSVSRYALTCGSPERAEMIAKEFLKESECLSENRGLSVYNGSYQHRIEDQQQVIPVTVFASGMGPSSAAIAFDEYVWGVYGQDHHRGPSVLIRVGTAGSWQEYVKVNDLVVVDGVVREEGSESVSPIIVPTRTHSLVTDSLIRSALDLELFERLWRGKSSCKEDLYACEDPAFRSSNDRLMRERQRALRRMGVIASSMESAPLALKTDFYNALSMITPFETLMDLSQSDLKKTFYKLLLRFNRHIPLVREHPPLGLRYGAILAIVSPDYRGPGLEIKVDRELESTAAQVALDALGRMYMWDQEGGELQRFYRERVI